MNRPGLKRIVVEKVMDEVNREKTNRPDVSGRSESPRNPRLMSLRPLSFSSAFSSAFPGYSSPRQGGFREESEPGIEREVPYPSC